jgi:hypothetical protein
LIFSTSGLIYDALATASTACTTGTATATTTSTACATSTTTAAAAAAPTAATGAEADTEANTKSDAKPCIVRINLALAAIRRHSACFVRVNIQILQIILKLIHLDSLRYVFMIFSAVRQE